jgi:hypothetical protein
MDVSNAKGRLGLGVSVPQEDTIKEDMRMLTRENPEKVIRLLPNSIETLRVFLIESPKEIQKWNKKGLKER